MKIATWNVNGIRARHEQFVQFAAEEQPDVICLQEIKARLDQIPQTCSRQFMLQTGGVVALPSFVTGFF